MSTQGKRLKNIRRELKLSQGQLGEILGVSRQYYSNIENDRDVLNNEKLIKLFQSFNVNINYILVGIGTMFINQASQNEKMVNDFEAVIKAAGIEVDKNGFLRKKNI